MFYEHTFLKEHNLKKLFFRYQQFYTQLFHISKMAYFQKQCPFINVFHTSFPTGALWKTLFFEYVDFTGFQRFKIISPQKLSTGFVDYSQLIHTQSFSEKITFSKTPFRFAYCIFLQISILYCNQVSIFVRQLLC